MSEFKECTACNGRGEVGNILDGDTCHHCKGSGVEREIPSLPEPVGSLQELHPEFAKVLHENFLELIGDDFPIENHISPNCKTIGEQS
ncbi:hypothetical protein BAX55_09260 [Acinetobacter baumannii]|uniref:DnaJ-class molecular chaperone with C-terminal Zn finger domain, putative n=1 Tax=Acinetobacter phage AP22 TaxID=1187128 RepID=I2GUD2_9CAUD|nr:DnaJ-class molecular chaperone with C-terminal Zn finger domain, putative [Acinetobacter baumannii]YP_006383775.1 DnaJ-class molecular chaperone with C-terminal Zn finger domain, putative [Acinetobacter phage AP22]MDK1633590.1 hypothetical protein [Acinetobacter baumannii]NAS43324.1 hypothetical protein [Acinetobacter baumannii]OBS06007.1 hypothetical protein BAX55_09260 [Acinetobacter baumannii]CCH57733.1 DnaJ-class molecular chaperone with C-terminal Zn finger domain, putative [Acinetobac